MTTPVGIYLPKNIFSEIDAITPLLSELHARGFALETIFFERSGYLEYTTSPFHQRVLGRISHVTRAFGAHPAVRVWRFLLFALTVLGHRMRGRRITFFYNDPPRGKSWAGDIWQALISGVIALGGGRRFAFPPIQAPATELFLRREEPDILAKRAVLEGIRVIAHPEPPAALAYTEVQKRGLRQLRGWKCPIEVIGLPRLYPAWQSAVKAEAEADVEAALAELGLPPDTPEVVTILMTAPNFVWLRPEHNFFALVRETVEEVRRVFPGLPILLKAKPRYNPAAFLGEGKIQLGDGVHLCVCSLAALSTRTRVAISIHETSGVFDFLTQGVPVVEYADYAPAWKELFPTPSPWVGLPGFRLAQSRDALAATLEEVRDGRFRSDPDQLGDALGHRINLDFFGAPSCENS